MFAPGLPDKKIKSKIPSVSSPQDWVLSVQEHKADKAGKHYDVRMVSPGGKAYSWATRYEPLKSGKKNLLVRQPDHTAEYALNFSGKIDSGYGKGTVKIIKKAPIQVSRISDRAIHFSMFKGREPHEFVLVNTGGDDWILQKRKNEIEKVKPKIQGKERYKSTSDIDNLINSKRIALSPKIDGAMSHIVLRSGKAPRVFSPRDGKGGAPLEYTHKIGDLISRRVPKDMDGIAMKGEVYGVNRNTGRVIPLNELSGILNSGYWKSKDKLDGSVDLRVGLFPYISGIKRGVQANLNLKDRVRLINSISKFLGPNVDPVPMAFSTAAKRRLVEKVKSKIHPLTTEGVVAYEDYGRPTKAKFEDDYHDVYIRGLVPGKGRLKNSVGAFTYSHDPDGKIVGRVGSGLDDRTREEMAKNPDSFIGRVARVLALGKYNSGALRGPRYIDLHQDK